MTEALYLPDFIVGKKIIIETKGHFDKDDRRKMRDVKRCNPQLDIRLVFQKDNKLSKAKRSKKYSQWAEYHGFKWAIGVIPDEWIEEFYTLDTASELALGLPPEPKTRRLPKPNNQRGPQDKRLGRPPKKKN